MKLLTAALLANTLVITHSAHAADQKSIALLHQALEAQGGEQKLRALKSLQWEAVGYRNELEESERPEGPYIVEFDTLSEIHDLAGNRYRRVNDAAVYPVFKFSSGSLADGNVVIRLAGDNKSPGTPQQLQVIHERAALSPERLLITALDAADLHAEPDTVLQFVPQNVVSFTLDQAPVRIYLNAYTHLPQQSITPARSRATASSSSWKTPACARTTACGGWRRAASISPCSGTSKATACPTRCTSSANYRSTSH